MAQSTTAWDSLTNSINKSVNDTNKVNNYFKLGQQFEMTDAANRAKNFMLAIQLGKKLKFNRGIKKIR